MKLCPHVKDKCCTLVDEIRIQKFWNYRTAPFISQYYDQVIQNLSGLMNLYNKIAEMDPQDMLIKYMETKRVPYQYEYCNSLFEPFDDDKIAIFNKDLNLLRMQNI